MHQLRKPLPSIPRIIITAALLAVAILITHTATEKAVRGKEWEAIDTVLVQQQDAIRGLTEALEDQQAQMAELSRSVSALQSRIDELQFKINPDLPLSGDLQSYTYYTCLRYGIPYDEFLAMMWRESRFTPNAMNVNANGTQDMGICQINQVAVPFLLERGVDPYASPEDNITAP